MNHYLILETNVTELEYLDPDLFSSDVDEALVLSSSSSPVGQVEEESQSSSYPYQTETPDISPCIEIHLVYHPIYRVPSCFVRYLTEASLLLKAQHQPSLQASLQAATYVILSSYDI